MSNVIHIVGDVHMDADEPKTWELFFSYLTNEAKVAKHIYLIGDIYDAWLGDDDPCELATSSIKIFKQLVDSGTKVSFIFGNHDFMLGKSFSRQTGIKLLGEQVVIDVGTKKTILLHGDTLITEDVKYQQARKKILKPWYLFYARCLPLKVRKQKANQMLNNESSTGFYAKGSKVDDAYVNKLLDEYGADVLVHGHTHEPQKIDLANNRVRWVVPAWDTQDTEGKKQGGWLEVTTDENGQTNWQLVTYPA